MAYNYLFRIIIVGHPGVGKTSLLGELRGSKLSNVYEPTIGIDFGAVTTILLNNKNIKSHIWDTAGQEYFSAIVRSYYRNIAGAILMFDVNNIESFHRIKYWLDEIHAENKNPGKLVLVGNKIDLNEREVCEDAAKELAKDHGMNYYEISIKDRENISTFYYDFINSIYDTIEDDENLPPGIKLYPFTEKDLLNTNTASSTDCCIII